MTFLSGSGEPDVTFVRADDIVEVAALRLLGEAERDEQSLSLIPRAIGLRKARPQLLAPPFDRDDPQGDRQRSAVKLLGELGDRCQPLYQLLVVERALDQRGGVAARLTVRGVVLG